MILRFLKRKYPAFSFPVFLFFSSWFLYFTVLWARVFFYDKDGNLCFSAVNLWRDWNVHFAMGSAMAFRKLFLLSNPLVYGVPFNYPFLCNFLSAVLIRAGVPFLTAFIVPSYFFSLLLVFALFTFYKALFRSHSIGMTASMIFLFNGGMGFLYFFQDIFASSSPFSTLLSPPQRYTCLDQCGIAWVSVIDSMVLPQRAFNHGFPLALLALAWVWTYFRSPVKRNNQAKGFFNGKRRLLWAGVLLGVMPFIHTHSFLASCVILACWLGADLVSPIEMTFKKQWVDWGSFFLILSIIGLPLVWILTATHVTQHHFIRWFPGWLAAENGINWFVFWWRNWGLVPLSAILGFLLLLSSADGRKQRLTYFLTFLPFFILFTAINLFIFQPWSWDNTKLLVWASLGFSGLAAYAIHWLLNAIRVSSFRRLRPFLLPVPMALFVLMVLSGFIDDYRLLQRRLSIYVMFSKEEFSLAAWVRNHTDPDSTWLSRPTTDQWLFSLTGRKVLLTFPATAWTHGYSSAQLEKDIDAMYVSPASPLFDSYGIEYIVVDKNDKKQNDLFAAYYPEIHKAGGVVIYKRPLRRAGNS